MQRQLKPKENKWISALKDHVQNMQNSQQLLFVSNSKIIDLMAVNQPEGRRITRNKGRTSNNTIVLQTLFKAYQEKGIQTGILFCSLMFPFLPDYIYKKKGGHNNVKFTLKKKNTIWILYKFRSFK